MTRQQVLVLALLLEVPTSAWAQRPLASAPDSATYRALLSRLIAKDTTVDFTALRMAYAASPQYAPYGSPADDHRDSLNAALRRQDYQRAIDEADSALGVDYLDVRTHVLRAYAAERRGDSLTARWDRVIATRLVNSVTGSGAGTRDSPYVVISVAEEYAVLGMNNYERGMQALSDCNGRPCDVLEATDRQTHEKHTLYFDISLPKAHLDRLFDAKH
jgi:hypothetical protein